MRQADLAILVLIHGVDHVLNLTVTDVAGEVFENKSVEEKVKWFVGNIHQNFISSGGMQPSSSLLNTLKLSL